MSIYRRVIFFVLAVTVLILLFRPSTNHGDESHKPGLNHHRSSKSVFSSLFRGHKIFRSQNPLNELSHKPLRSQLSYQFPYYPTSEFPTYIWQTWKTTPASDDFPRDWRGFENTWTETHPHFTHQVISDSAALHILFHLYSGIPDVIEAYTSLPKAVLKADFFRYLILLARGGIYTDIDTTVIRPSSQWVPKSVPQSSYGLVIGIEADPDREDWAEWYSRRVQFCQWTIQAKPGHPVLVEIVARVTEETLRRKRFGTLHTYVSSEVIEFTGPAIWTDVVFDFFNDKKFFDMSQDKSKEDITWKQFTGMTKQKKVGDVVVLPITCFSPGVRQMGAGEDDDPMAFVKHTFDGSWKPKEERWIGDPERDKKLDGTIIGHG